MPNKKTPNNRIHVLPDRRFGFLRWIVKFVNRSLQESYVKGGGVWCNDLNGIPKCGVFAKMRTKALALEEAITQAKAFQPCSLRVHGTDGRIQEERTYPRSAESQRKG